MSVFLRDDVETATKEVLYKLCELSKSSHDHILKSEKNKSVLKTPLQICIEYKFDDALKNAIHKILIEYCFSAESASPGSFVKTLHYVKDKYENKSCTVSSVIASTPTVNDIKNMISNMSNDHVLNSVIFEAISLAGFKGNISIEKSLNSITSIELTDGYKFKHKPLSNIRPVKLSKPKIVIIDGFIESVAEINKLFQEACDTKHSTILIARGMHDDVVTTCKVNRDRSTMFVYPVIIEFDLNGINTINDICVVSGCLPISQNLGNLISEASLLKAPIVDECTIINDSIVIRNRKTRSAVSHHTNMLIQKRNSSREGVDELISSRIKSLMNSNVIIRLPDDAKYVHKSQVVDYALRSFRSMLDYGLNDDNDLYATECLSRLKSDSIIKVLKSIRCYLDS